MRVLILQSELGVLRGGGENFTRNLFSAFVDRGHHVRAAFVADRKGQYALSLPAGIEPIPIPGWWSSTLGQRTLATIGGYLRYGSRLRSLLDRIQVQLGWRAWAWHNRRFQRAVESRFARSWNDFDAVYVHGNAHLASSVARFRPTLIRLPGPVTEERAPLLRAVHAVCANGDALVRIQSFLGDHVTELPIGLDVGRFAPGGSSVRPALGWGDRDLVVGYVGRLTHLKGVDLLAAAFREISRDFPNARLLIVGKGEEERHIRSVLADEFVRGAAHIEHDVEHETLPAWYRAMDLLVMPSRYENHSNALLEGMGCGTPFVASAIGGNRQFGETGAGWLFEAKSAVALTESLRHILQNPVQLKSRGERGARCMRAHHSWAASAERLEQIISTRLGVTT